MGGGGVGVCEQCMHACVCMYVCMRLCVRGGGGGVRAVPRTSGRIIDRDRDEGDGEGVRGGCSSGGSGDGVVECLAVL